MVDQRFVWGGVAIGGAGIAIYLYRKDKKKTAQTSQPGSTAPYAYGYGAYGYGNLTYAYGGYGYGAGSPYGGGGYGGGVTPYPPYNPGYGYGYGSGTGTGGGTTPVSNAQWASQAAGVLETSGYNGTAVMAALGIYLAGGNLNQNQAQIVSAAIAVTGYPPQSGANGFPPQMNTGGGGGTGQGGTGIGGSTGFGYGYGSVPPGPTVGGTVQVPFTVGLQAGMAHDHIVAAGLVPKAPKGQKATWVVTSTNPGGGTQAQQGSAVTIYAKK